MSLTDKFKLLKGRAAQGAKRPLKGANKPTEQKRQENLAIAESFDAEDHTVTKEDELREKYINNRYLYGLNSAGVFVYLHDQSDVIDEILLLPTSSITTKLFDKSTVAGSTGLIRPVSDERGFEVIGHFRYGRGVSLRDGSLVLQNQGKKANDKANVAATTALSGSLFATLQAQSAGITTGSVSNVNPVDAINRLTPEDAQTAAVINPEGKAEYNEAANFVSAAPLGSPEQVGLTNSSSIADVEASQLSRALTLAEMKVRDDALATDVSSNCPCLLGRNDLGFIAVGYQLRAISSSNSSEETIQYGALSSLIDSENASATQAIIAYLADSEAAQDEAEEKVRAAQDKDDLKWFNPQAWEEQTTNKIVTAREKARVEYEAAHANELPANLNTTQLGAIASAIKDGGPIVDMYNDLSNPGSIELRVETFLSNLYEGLDAAHQEYEAQLRGGVDTLDSRVPKPEGMPKPESNIAPPFGGPARALGGDPEAIGLGASSAADNIAKSFQTLSSDLKKEANKVALTFEIKKLEAALKGLESDAAETEARTDAGVATHKAVVAKVKLSDTEGNIEKTKQRIMNMKLELENLDA